MNWLLFEFADNGTNLMILIQMALFHFNNSKALINVLSWHLYNTIIYSFESQIIIVYYPDRCWFSITHLFCIVWKQLNLFHCLQGIRILCHIYHKSFTSCSLFSAHKMAKPKFTLTVYSIKAKSIYSLYNSIQ